VHSDGDVESLVKFHSPSARPTVCGIVPEGDLPEWDRELALPLAPLRGL
jgi:hypothetical protein